MGLTNKRKNSRDLFDFEQIPAIFLIQNVKEQSPPLSLRSISPRGERALLSYGIGNQDCFERFYGDLIRRLRRHLPQRGKAFRASSSISNPLG